MNLIKSFFLEVSLQARHTALKINTLGEAKVTLPEGLDLSKIP